MPASLKTPAALPQDLSRRIDRKLAIPDHHRTGANPGKSDSVLSRVWTKEHLVNSDLPFFLRNKPTMIPKPSSRGANHEVHIVNWNTGVLEVESASFTVCTSRFSPSLIHDLYAIFASNSRFMCLFQAALDTCLDGPLPCQPLGSRFVPHDLRALD